MYYIIYMGYTEKLYRIRNGCPDWWSGARSVIPYTWWVSRSQVRALVRVIMGLWEATEVSVPVSLSLCLSLDLLYPYLKHILR